VKATCRNCRADVEVPEYLPSKTPVLCDTCASAAVIGAHRRALAPALTSVPERYRDANLDDFTRIPDVARSRIDPTSMLATRILVIHGPTASGKTTLAAALFRWFVERPRPDEVDKAMRAVRSRFFAAADIPVGCRFVEEGETMRRAKAAPFAVIDDVGQEGNVGAQAVKVVLLSRAEHNRRTIITTADGLDEATRRWTASYGAGVTRRYFEDADVKIVELHRRTER